MSASAADAQTIAHPKSFLMASSAAHMTPQERTSSFSLASIFALRMFGLFIILPVFAVYARELPGGDSETLVGITLGIYGLTQGLLQIPFGVASDRLGRKPVIIFGLIIFALGSFLAASGANIWIVMLGRMLQGAGAISAAVTALNNAGFYNIAFCDQNGNPVSGNENATVTGVSPTGKQSTDSTITLTVALSGSGSGSGTSTGDDSGTTN